MTTAATIRPPMLVAELLEVAARYVLLGPQAVGQEELAAAQAEVARWLALTEETGMTERDVVRVVLRPVLSWERHCHCRACRERCVVCHPRPFPAASPD